MRRLDEINQGELGAKVRWLVSLDFAVERSLLCLDDLTAEEFFGLQVLHEERRLFEKNSAEEAAREQAQNNGIQRTLARRSG